MSDQQVDLRHVRDNLGHASIATTSIYLHTEDDARHEATEDKHRIGWTHKGIGRPPTTPPMTASSRKSYLYFHESEILPKCSCSPDRGETAMRELRQHVGMVFQNFNLFPHLTAAQNVMLAPRLVRHMPKEQSGADARRLLQRVGLGERADHYPDQLSGGQQQRVAIARALAMNPAVLLCDEITSALDPELVGEVLAVVEGLAKDGMTLIMVTHEMNFARKVSDRVIFMHQGKVHEMGPPDQLFSSPSTPELRQFLSSIH